MGGRGGWRVTSVLVARSPGLPGQLQVGSPWGFAPELLLRRGLFARSLGHVQGQVHFSGDLQIGCQRQCLLGSCVKHPVSGGEAGVFGGSSGAVFRDHEEPGRKGGPDGQQGQAEGNREWEAGGLASWVGRS